MTTAHRIDVDHLRDVADLRRRELRIPPSHAARQYLDTQHMREAQQARARAWEQLQRDRLMDRCPPSALAPVVRCRPLSVWARIARAVRNLFR